MLIAGIAVLISGALGVCIWWWLPIRQIRNLEGQIEDPKDRADVEDNFRKTVGQLLGGAAVLVGIAVAYLQFVQQQRATLDQFMQQQAAIHKQIAVQQEAAESTRKASQDLLVSNQVAKGFEQLGNPNNIHTRIGGIYLLEGVMNAAPEYFQPILDALCTFVRVTSVQSASNGPVSADIQAALTVIGRRKSGLGAVNLAKAKLKDANFGAADLRGADLSFADLTAANLSSANLGPAKDDGSALNDSEMSVVLVSGAAKDHPFPRRPPDLGGRTRVYLSESEITAARLTSPNLRTHVDPIGEAHLRVTNLIGATLTEADLSHTNLTGALLGRAVFTRANLTEADLRGAYLRHSKLDQISGYKLDLSSAYLADASMNGSMGRAKFVGADLSSAIVGGYLEASSFVKAKLHETKLSGNLTQADLREADFDGTDLSGAILYDPEYIYIPAQLSRPDQLSRACGTNVRLPFGIPELRPCR
jgi:uncharacterized protein YjbI with pentapeptide repeats